MAARRVGPVAKALQSGSPAESRSAGAVVGDGELECALGAGHAISTWPALRVFDGVGGSFGGDVVGRGLDLGMQPPDVVGCHLNGCGRAPREGPQGGG